MATKVFFTDESEDLQVESWRWQTLMLAGVGTKTAEMLAKGNADLHQMVRVKQQGCTDELLLRIFT